MKLSLTLTWPVLNYPTYQHPKPEANVSAIEAEGDGTMIAGYLRAMADSIDPPMQQLSPDALEALR
jgi:hypothetical protein